MKKTLFIILFIVAITGCEKETIVEKEYVDVYIDKEIVFENTSWIYYETSTKIHIVEFKDYMRVIYEVNSDGNITNSNGTFYVDDDIAYLSFENMVPDRFEALIYSKHLYFIDIEESTITVFDKH